MDLQQFHELEGKCTQEDMPRCAAACPVHVDAKGMIAAARKGDFSKAYAIFAQTAPFPGIISHVCDHPCQDACKRGEIDGGIAINALERACGAFSGWPRRKKGLIVRKNKKVAVVGAGMSGLSAAWFLAGKGYKVTVFDAGNALGGSLTGLSEDRLPRRVMADDFAMLATLGIQTTFAVTVGNNSDAAVKFTTLLEEFDAIFLGLGRESPPGLDLGLELHDDGTIRIDPVTLGTSNPKVFAGGSHRQDKDRLSPIHSVSDGKSAMISIDRFLQGASLTLCRSNEGPQHTRLFTDIAGIAPRPGTAMADPTLGYAREEAVSEAERCLGCRCMACFNHCEYMKHYRAAPRILARQIFKNKSGVGGHRFNQQMNSCSLCRQCEAICQDSFSMADICRAAREALVQDGKMPPSAFGFALQDLRYSRSDAFTLVRHEPGHSTSEVAFYPGCQLCGSAPWQVMRTYAYLREKISGGVALMLGCCGVQADWAGEKEMFLDTLESTRSQWKSLGEPKVLLGCPTCFMIFKRHLPEITIEFLFPFIERIGIPETATGAPLTVAVHDSCTTRYEKGIQDSVRSILQQRGHAVEELKTSGELTECCGFGGLMQISNKDLAHKVVDRRTGESDNDYLVYCAMCRDNFTNQGKRAYHLLDLIFGDEAGNIAARPPVGYSQRHENRARLKAQALREIWNEDMRNEQPLMPLAVSPETRARMEDDLVLDSDVRSVIEYAERTGNKLLNTATGHFFAYFKPAYVTYWVEYTSDEHGFTIHDAYCHRLEILDAGAEAS
ncbi:MAG: FAD-dependent oxidoreductase [Desulfovibrio sp.]|jgi:NADPH-dependent glutamate synthase beta subunit-like oxidoreductase|nr:FAD-dependent oxidoreductase [Desulfovibrio sp.]